MKLSKAISYVNQALNYPSLSLQDIDLFFDEGMAELNTTLHIALPTISTIIEEFKQNMSKTIAKQTTVLQVDPTTQTFLYVPKYKSHVSYTAGNYIAYTEKLYQVTQNIDAVSNIDFTAVSTTEVTKLMDSNTGNIVKYFYNADLQKFGLWNTTNQEYNYYMNIYGWYYRTNSSTAMPEKEFYVSTILGSDALWLLNQLDIEDCELAQYIPDDWVLLWLVPYVCYKYTCRDGGTAQTFAEELTQGFQQLQDTYDVPSTIVLLTVADKPAYRQYVEKCLPNLNVRVPTRAIYEMMKHGRNVNGIYGNMNDRGGFL